MIVGTAKLEILRASWQAEIQVKADDADFTDFNLKLEIQIEFLCCILEAEFHLWETSRETLAFKTFN